MLYEPDCGCTIHDACKEIVLRAASLNGLVTMTFNGVNITASPYSRIDALVEEYHQNLRATAGVVVVTGSPKFDDEYLGDGVYASFDGYSIWLDTRAQETVHRICLEPEVMSQLKRYEQRVIESMMQEAEKDGEDDEPH